MTVWAGVDVGDLRKGFHVAVIDEKRVLEPPAVHRTAAEALRWLAEHAPFLTAIDSPAAPAPSGASARTDELHVNRAICGIRWTPSLDVLRGNQTYYGWILRGLELYAALDEAGLRTIECFPTASWTRWSGPRGRRTRARWTSEALPALGLADVPPRTNQDVRDALAAAATARAWTNGLTESFGSIVVPL
jgi:predicted nuclease with RNAse H fold